MLVTLIGEGIFLTQRTLVNMQKLKQIEARGLYIFIGKSSANSSLIETKKEAFEMISSANSRFAGFLRIREHLISQDSWTFICEVEDEETIISTYLSKREASGRKYKLPALTEIWRIVSEQVRNFLSRFVKFCNYERGRTGSLVHSNYERYYFENEEEALIFIAKIHEQNHDFSQYNCTYRPNSKRFHFTRKERIGHVFLCSKNLESLILLGFRGVGSIIRSRLIDDILRKLISLTISIHSNTLTTQNPVKIE